MNWCCDCKNKYTNTKCDNCKSMSNYEKGDATVELLEKIKAEIGRIKTEEGGDFLERPATDIIYEAQKIIDKHIAELKGE